MPGTERHGELKSSTSSENHSESTRYEHQKPCGSMPSVRIDKTHTNGHIPKQVQHQTSWAKLNSKRTP